MTAEWHIRKIHPQDNRAIAGIVRSAMKDFKADPLTTIIGDPTLDTMYENYREKNAVYFVAVFNDEVAGGCGIRHLQDGPPDTCELQRMFLSKQARGKGIGKMLLTRCISEAKRFGYSRIYLETLDDMVAAKSLYASSGFRTIDNRMGNTGHTGCNVKMLLDLKGSVIL